MNRFARTLGLSAVLALVLAAAALGAAPRAQLRGFVCQPALEPALRAVSVTSVMRPVRGTQAMAVRFELLSRARGAAGFTPLTVAGTDLGHWISPADRTLGRQPGDVWILNKPVVDLPAPAAYRLRVHFRWTGAHHRVLATATKTTAACLQPELRPDLAIRWIAEPRLDLTGTRDLYSVTVANDGATAAGAFYVQLAAPGGTTRLLITRLAAHTAKQVSLRGPLCTPAGPPTVTVDPPDPNHSVDDFNRRNNAATVSCTSATQPFPGS
ncbi:MAG TPA: CARDB domain-containing protein [Solirubrobacteraceae bacterium]|nr:CARDB domain-containing protein [Solirubrobacteraceae bacterium]